MVGRHGDRVWDSGVGDVELGEVGQRADDEGRDDEEPGPVQTVGGPGHCRDHRRSEEGLD